MNITLYINNTPITVSAGTSLLQAVQTLGFTIPTMCYQDGLPHNTSCMICVVEETRTGKLLPSCSARAEDGMSIETNNDRIRQFRKDTLDLLLSEHVGDCQAPCQRICPAYMDIPLMIRQIQQQDWQAAIRTVKAEIALPAVLGRICPAPCENGCNRKQHDSPVSICLLKRIVADIDLESDEPYRPVVKSSSNKTVAIVGAGPGGLSAAYYLAQFGHKCTIFDKNERPGGNLRYAVPKDRLPRDVLDAEIELLRALGIEFSMNTSLGSDVSLDELRNKYDAIVLMTGDLNSALYESTPLELSKRGLSVNRKTLSTNIEGIFAGGSLVSSSKMAVRAVGHGKSIAHSVDQFLSDKTITGRSQRFNSLMGRLQEGEAKEFLKEADSAERIEPVANGFSHDEAIREAQRCFRCDCRKQESCKLRLYSDEYDASQSRFRISKRHAFERQVQHDLVVFEPGKCIKCGLCVQITANAGEQFGFTFIRRGFNVKISIPFQEALDRGLAQVARECAESCPTAAISFKNHESVP